MKRIIEGDILISNEIVTQSKNNSMGVKTKNSNYIYSLNLANIEKYAKGKLNTYFLNKLNSE